MVRKIKKKKKQERKINESPCVGRKVERKVKRNKTKKTRKKKKKKKLWLIKYVVF